MVMMPPRPPGLSHCEKKIEMSSDRATRKRSRVATQLAILNALEEILAESGFEGLGVNVVAKRAGVSKELIYRYFGGLEKLILAWVEERDYWSFHKIDQSQERLARAGAGSQRMLGQSLSSFVTDMRESPHLQEIRRWEVHSRSDLAGRIARRREEAGVRMLGRVPPAGDHDVAAIYGILQAGLCYLILRSSALETYCGVDIRSDQGWARFLRAADHMLDTALAVVPPDKAEDV